MDSNSNSNNSNNQQINELNKTINEKDKQIIELYKENKELLYKNEGLYKQILELSQEKDKQIFELHKQIQEKDNLIQEKKIEEQEKEIKEKWKKEVKYKNNQIKKMKPIFDEYEKQEIKKNFPQFSDSEIIKDIEYVKKLEEWINDNDFFSKIKKGFSAKRDGFSGQNWHKAVDGKGKTLIIIKTKDNFIFGGFTQVGFNSANGEWINDSNSFIFSLRNDTGDRKPEKFTIKQPQYAIYSNWHNYGPIFGYGGLSGHDFYLNDHLQPGYSDFGYSYNLPNGIEYGKNEARSYLAGSPNSWIVDEVESYFIPI
ncbi:hypothetical protein M0811_14145 [Anaeramoeba ignava]|uniref:TLDc domain-containing protein n=1 Tax=Anaeramoeba ignava TaxID=1746090 RepID=A0A9Q0RHS9_ANAIG|nr:hypothetical protein M0811_14145 [Anaeramoeba ignava]